MSLKQDVHAVVQQVVWDVEELDEHLHEDIFGLEARIEALEKAAAAKVESAVAAVEAEVKKL